MFSVTIVSTSTTCKRLVGLLCTAAVMLATRMSECIVWLHGAGGEVPCYSRAKWALYAALTLI